MTLGRGVLYVATLAGIAFAARSIGTGPPPWPLAFAVLAGYLALVTAGVVFMRFGMFLPVVSAGPSGATGIALTFDDGPDPGHTERVLEALEAAGAKAAFFVIGHKAARHPELVRAIARAGRAIGVHGYHHSRLFALRGRRYVARDLRRAVAVIEELTGERPYLFRPPIGHMSPTIASVARELGLSAVGWSLRGVDGWAGARPERVAARVSRGLRHGAIVLLHDGAERGTHEPAAVRALPDILATAVQNGLGFVRVDAWVPDSRR